MGSVNIRNVDLNLLVALHALLEERSITLAARRLFVSQPAMSRIKDRLQAMFGDELLVRTTKGYEPTNRALALYTQLQRLLPELNGLFVQRELDLTTAREIFRIETTDWGGTVLIPKMVHIVMQRAPGIEIDIFPRNVGFEDLEANVVDLVLAGAIQPLQDAFATNATHLRSEVILRERLVCVVRACPSGSSARLRRLRRS